MENFHQRNIRMSQSSYKNLVFSKIVKDRYMLHIHYYDSQVSFLAIELHFKKQKQKRTKHCIFKKKKDWKDMKQKVNSNYLWGVKFDVLNFTLL